MIGLNAKRDETGTGWLVFSKCQSCGARPTQTVEEDDSVFSWECGARYRFDTAGQELTIERQGE